MQSEINGVVEFDFPVHNDERGFFTEVIRQSSINKINTEFSVRQINHARSSKNTLRGIHVADWNKIIYVPCGRVQAVVVDFRKGSPTYGKYKSFILGDENRNSLFVPSGCGNSYLVLSDMADYIYFIDREWEPNQEIDIRWDDPDLAIDWQVKEGLSISERDQAAKSFKDLFE